MFARLLALCCLFISVCFPIRAASGQFAAAKLVVYLQTQATQSLRPLDSMKHELARLMRSAGYELEWRGPRDPNFDTGAFLAVVELRGDCEAASDAWLEGAALPDIADLASTFVSEGRVLPFSWVNCGNVTKLLAAALTGQPGAVADFILGRAVARLLAHEFYHMLMQTTQHTGAGISKPCFTSGDLLSQRFEFEHSVVAALQTCRAGRQPMETSSPSLGAGAAEPITGRGSAGRQNQ
jgi:hypothetical protein